MYTRILVSIFLLTSLAAGQETRSMIYGRVLDPQSSAVANATVTVTSLNTNTSRTLTTNDSGYYEANLLLPGNYQVTVEAAGFKKFVRGGILLPISTRTQIAVTLELGGLAETVTVTEEAPLLESNAVTTGLIMDNRSISELPVARANPALLMGFAPGLQMRGGYRTTAHFAASILVENLYLPNKVGQNELLIDGVPNVGLGRRVAFIPHTDALQEFKVETSGFDASIGFTVGASISMMTKAGTNQLHGSLIEQHMQQRWNAAPFFLKQAYFRNISQAATSGDNARADFLRSQPMQQSGRSNNYAATIGGPIVIPKAINGKDKLFFFVAFNGTNERLTEATSNINVTIPTLANRQGDFSQLLRADPVRYAIHDPLSVRADPARDTHFIRDPFPGNLIPASRVANPAYNAYAKFLPNPNNDPTDPRREPLNNYIATGMPWNFDYYSISNRVDYQMSQRHRLFGRWSWSDYAEHRADYTYESAPGLHDQDLVRHNIGGTVDWVFTPSATKLVDVSFSVNEYRQIGAKATVTKQLKAADVNLPAYLDTKAGAETILPTAVLPGYRNISRSYENFLRGRTFNLKADYSDIRGAHSLRAGFANRQYFRTGGGGGSTTGQFSFSNQFTRRNEDTFTPAGDLGHSWAAFMLGIPNGMSIDTNDSFAAHSPAYAWYVHDTWRVTPKLTLNLGLRLEYEQGITERYNRLIGEFDPRASVPIAEAARAAYARSPVPELAAGSFQVAGGAVYPGSGGLGRRLIRNESMWMPRLAAAYQLDKNTVLRTGYGVNYDTINAGYVGPNQFGFSRTTSTNLTDDFGVNWLVGNPRAGVSPLRDPFPVRADGTRFDAPFRDSLGVLAVAGRAFSYRQFGNLRPRQQRWRAGVQRQFGANAVIEVAYAGAYSDRVSVSRSVNALPEQYWADGLTRNNAIPTNLNANVANPFRLTNFDSLRTANPAAYQNLSTLGFFTSATIQKNQLLRPFPHMPSLTNSADSAGEARSDQLEVNFMRRFAEGFNVNVGYTRLRAREADIFLNEFDRDPSWRDTIEGAPHRLTVTGIFELPFGKNKRFFSQGLPALLAGGFQFGATYEYQTGQLLDWPNLFFYGNLGDVASGPRLLDQWFNLDGFERNSARAPAAFHKRVFPTRVAGARWMPVNDWNLNVQRDFRFTERVRFQLRFDAVNAFNHTVFGPPETNPLSTNFGRILTQTETPNRVLYFQGKVQF